MVPPSLLRVPGLAAANLVTLVMYAALGAHLLFLPVYLQFLGFSPTLAGLVFAPPSIGLILLAPRFGRYADRNGPRLPIAVARRRSASRCCCCCRPRPRRRVDVGRREHLPLRDRAAGRRRADHGGRAFPGPEDLAGVAAGLNQTVARVGGILSVAAIGALAGALFVDQGGTGDTPFDPSAERCRARAGVDAFHGVFSASPASRSWRRFSRRPSCAVTVRAGRPRA